MQTVCTSLQTDNHANTLSLNFYRAMLFLMPNQQCQSTEGQSTSIYLNSLVVDIWPVMSDYSLKVQRWLQSWTFKLNYVIYKKLGDFLYWLYSNISVISGHNISSEIMWI